MKNKQLDKLISPQNAVAVCGSASPGKLGAVLLSRLKSGGYTKLYAVNPKAQGLDGIAGYPNIKDIPEQVDMVVIASPKHTVNSILEDAGSAGVGAATIISSGFGEAGEHELEAQIIKTAKKYGIRFIGPNCAGLINLNAGLTASLEANGAVGNAALISQSGAVGGLINSLSFEYGVGISKFLSYGNGADINEGELLSYLEDDDETEVVAMYLENVKDGQRFMSALKSASAKKPVIVIKSGRTQSGTRAAMSHTGSMAGSDRVYDAVFEKCGAIRADSIEDMFDYIRGFSAYKSIGARSVAIITNSGGPGVLTADECDRAGLLLSPLSESLRSTLNNTLPAYAGLSNPIDVTVEGSPAQYEAAIVEALKEFDAAIVIYVGTPYLMASEYAQAIVRAQKSADKPVFCCFAVGSDIDEAKSLLRDAKIPNFVSGERAVHAIKKLCDFCLKKPALSCIPTKERTLAKFDEGVILEPFAMKLLSENGVSVPDFRFVNDVKAIAGACAELNGYPVCMKVVSPDIIHKSDFGGVILNIGSDAEAEAAFYSLRAICEGKRFCGTIIYPMLKSDAEVIMGFTRDSRFGPVIAFGMGGVYTEIYKDVALGLAPLSFDAAMDMIRSVKAYGILAGARGKRPLAIEDIAKNLVAFSQIPIKYQNIREADVNPLFVTESSALAGDVRFLE